MSYINVWVSLNGFKRIKEGISARGKSNNSNHYHILLTLPLSAVYFDDDYQEFIILDKQNW